MTIFELQKKIAHALNDLETLVQCGCKAFAEDTRTVYDESRQFISEGGVAIVVVTPRFSRNGCAVGGIPCDTRLQVKCVELPPVSDTNAGTMRALDVAEIVAHALDSDAIQFQEIDQSVTTDRDGNTVVTATVTFTTLLKLTKGE